MTHCWRRVLVLFGLIAASAYASAALAENPHNTSSAKLTSLSAQETSQRADSNVTLVGRWPKGECWTAAAAGDTVLVGNGACVDVVDLSDAENPRLLAATCFSGPVTDVAWLGSRLYVASAEDGVTVVDLADVENPRILGSCPLPRTPSDVAVDSTYVYAVASDSGLYVLDVADPANLALVGHRSSDGLRFHGVAVGPGHAFVAAGRSGGLRVFDVHDPTHPVEVGSLRVEGDLRRLVLQDTLLYGVEDPNALVVIDVSNPSHPSLLARYNRHGRDLAVSGYLAFLAGDDEFHVLDISDPRSPNEVGAYDFPGRRRVKRLAVSRDHAYLADPSAGLWVVDVRNTAAPEPEGLYPTPGRTEKIALAAGLGCAAGGTRAGSVRGVTLLDLRDPANRVEIWPRILRDYLVLNLACSDSFAYVAVGNQVDSILCVDLRHPETPEVAGRFGPLRATALALKDTLLFAAGTDPFHREVLYVIDVSDPTKPRKIAACLLKVPGTIWDVAIGDGFAYVAREGEGLQVVDVRNPTSPRPVGQVKCTALAGGVAVRGNYAFVTDRYPTGVLSVVDVSDPGNPAEVATYDFGVACYGVAVQGPFAYVAASSRGLRVLDVRDPLHPVEVGYFDTPGLAMQVAADTHFVYVADGPAGVAILRNDVVLSAVSRTHATLPTACSLNPCYPNPFNTCTWIDYELPRRTQVDLAVYNLQGQRVRTLLSRTLPAGSHRLRWDGTGDAGRPLPSGVYLVQLREARQATVQKVVLMR